MKELLLMIVAVVMAQSVLAADKKPLIADPYFEKVIRLHIKKPTGELTKADLEKVRRLSLFNTQITDVGLKEVAKLKRLSWLDLQGTKITDTGLKDVAKLQNLTRLVLSNTKITDAGLKELAKCKQLRELYPRFSKVTKAGIAQLQKALPKCKVDWP